MKIKKQYLIPAILASAIVLMQNPLAFAGSKEVDEELSPYKWGHWDRMVPPAAGPVALAPSPVTAALPSTPDPVPPPPPSPELKPIMYDQITDYGTDIKPHSQKQVLTRSFDMSNGGGSDNTR